MTSGGKVTDKSAEGRGSGSAATRAALLGAAQRLFAARGLDGVSVRDVAGAAGVNAALVIRYFGSKESLFLEAISGPQPAAEVLGGDLSDLGARLAQYALSKPDTDPLLTLLRSASGKTGAALLQGAVQAGFIVPLAARLGGEGREERAALIAAQVLGLSVLGRMLGMAVLTSDPDTVHRHSAHVLQHLIDGVP